MIVFHALFRPKEGIIKLKDLDSEGRIRGLFGIRVIFPHRGRAFNMCGDFAAPNPYAVAQQN